MDPARGAQGGDRRQPARPVLSAYLIVVRLLTGGGGRLQSATRTRLLGRLKLAGGRGVLAAVVGFLTVALAGPAVSAPARPAPPADRSPRPTPASPAAPAGSVTAQHKKRSMVSIGSPVQKGDPVAVVYYLCDPAATGATCNSPPSNGFYYVHNAVAVENLPTNEGGAKVSHVPEWSGNPPKPTKIDTLDICGPGEAVKPPSTVKCHPTTDTKHTWIMKAIYTYPVGYIHSLGWQIGQPIAWVVSINNKLVDPHNGAFRCFKSSGSSDCDPDIKKIIRKPGEQATRLQGTLKYWHYVNKPPYGTGEDGRTAKSWEKFTLESEEITATGNDNITIQWRQV